MVEKNRCFFNYIFFVELSWSLLNRAQVCFWKPKRFSFF